MNTSRDATDTTRYYGLYLVWIKDPAKWNRYRELVAPIARRYGTVERSLRGTTIYFEGRTAPDVVNVVHSPSQKAFEQLDRDPEFQRIVHLRDESTELVSVFGDPIAGEVSSNAGQRAYVVEIAKFGAEGAAGYRRYEAEATPLLRRYGYHVERVFSVRGPSEGLPFQPDLVKVAYFEQPDGMARVESDPEHARIEGLYPSAVAQSVWIFGTAAH